jgi:hypothetical protein
VKLGITKPLKFIPAWCLNIFKFQIGCVYFFAGIAKLNYYWLFEAQPLSNWLKHQTDLMSIGQFMKYKSTAIIFSWVGCFFDLSVSFFLLFKKTRIPAYLAIVFFHTLTGIMFPIGVFPIVMIALTTIFFSPILFVNLFGKFSTDTLLETNSKKKNHLKWTVALLSFYLIIQVIMPFRYLLYPGNLFWTEQGYRFSWRVMLIEKVGYVNFFVIPDTGQGKKMIEENQYLTLQQTKQMSTQPDMILQFAHFLREEYKNKEFIENGDTIKIGQPKVFVTAYANLFNKGTHLLIDPQTDLSTVPFNLYNRTWITKYND